LDKLISESSIEGDTAIVLGMANEQGADESQLRQVSRPPARRICGNLQVL
jgi:hypothetical protein